MSEVIEPTPCDDTHKPEAKTMLHYFPGYQDHNTAEIAFAVYGESVCIDGKEETVIRGGQWMIGNATIREWLEKIVPQEADTEEKQSA